LIIQCVIRTRAGTDDVLPIILPTGQPIELKYEFLRGRTPYSHSILSMHRNALIYKRKIFLLAVKARPSSRQNFSLMISKQNSRDSNFARLRQLSPIIANDRSIFDFVGQHQAMQPGYKKTVSITICSRRIRQRSAIANQR
jgi:hypothetical protein